MWGLCFGEGSPNYENDHFTTHTLRSARLSMTSQRRKKGISTVTPSPRSRSQFKSEAPSVGNLQAETTHYETTIKRPHINLNHVKKRIRQSQIVDPLTTARSTCVLNPNNPIEADEQGQHRFGVRVNASGSIPVLDILLTIKAPNTVSANRLNTKPKKLSVNLFEQQQQTLSRQYRSARQVTFAVEESGWFSSKPSQQTPETGISRQDGSERLKFNRQQINTVYSQDDDEKIPVRAIDLSKVATELKLESSRFRVTSNSTREPQQQNYVYQESLVEQVSVMSNFQVLRTRKFSNHQLQVAMERNIGMLLLMKKTNTKKLQTISRELLLHQILKEGHCCIVAFYQYVQNEQRQHVLLYEYYEDTLETLVHSLTERDLAKMCDHLLAAFEFLIQKSIKLQLNLYDIAHVGGVYKICGLDSWCRTDLPQPLLPHYYKQLARLIETIYGLRDPILQQCQQSLMLKVFLKILSEGTLHISALRQHQFIRRNTQ